jgi:hypothetical protein
MHEAKNSKINVRKNEGEMGKYDIEFLDKNGDARQNF